MKVVLVAGICVERDAISASVATQAEMLSAMPEVTEVCVITQHCDRPVGVTTHIAANSWELLRHPAVAAADVVIFHWGIKYDLFDALPVVSSRIPTAVYFHNITPVALSDTGAEVIERSLLQIQLVEMAGSVVWSPSEFNLRTLAEWGVGGERTRVMPFVVERPVHVGAHARARIGSGTPKLLSVGRFVSSKGLHVLVDALALVRDRVGPEFNVVFAGSTMLSDGAYVAQLEEQIEHRRLSGQIELRTDLDDVQLWAEYDRADVLVSPSFHEGLCVPVIEAYIAGCRVVASDGGNLPFVVQPPDPVVPAGDVEALGDALTAMLASGVGPHPQVDAVEQLIEFYSRRSAREHLRRGLLDLAAGG